mgnify:CR=1 FL=1
MATKLYVGNLSFNTGEGDLRAAFEQVGPVVSCSLIMDKFTGKSRGFAFVGKDLDGRALTVNEAKPREERGSGGGGGGYGGGGGGGRDRRY